MSDCFDHAMDAFDSREREEGDGNYGGRSNFKPNPLFYHTKLRNVILMKESEKAFNLFYEERYLWIPKSICKNMDWELGEVHVHRDTFFKILATANSAKE